MQFYALNPQPIEDIDRYWEWNLEDAPWSVRVSMIQTMNGMTTINGSSADIGHEGDSHIYALNRALSDVIVVGAQTARTENYAGSSTKRLAYSAQQEDNEYSPLAIFSHSLNLDPESPVFTATHCPPIILTGKTHDAYRAELLHQAGGIIAPVLGDDGWARDAMTFLAGLGYRKILSEGGPTIVDQLIREDLIDQLSLSVTPIIEVANNRRTPSNLPDIYRQMRTLATLEDKEGYRYFLSERV